MNTRINYLLLIICFILSTELSAQGAKFEWVKENSGSTPIVSSMVSDEIGNLYLAGSFSGTVDFNPDTGVTNLTSNGTYDIFIQKLDSLGKLLWVHQIGNSGQYTASSISIDKNGNSYTTGNFSAVTDFDPSSGTNSLTPIGSYDTYILKLDAAGKFKWVKQMGGNLLVSAFANGVSTNGGVYTAGYFTDTVDFNLGTGTFNLISWGAFNGFIQKLDTAGNFSWVKQLKVAPIFNYNGFVTIRSLTTDASGAVYLTGDFSGSMDFDPSTGSKYLTANLNDIFILKLNNAGNLEWVRQIGGSSRFEESYSIVTDTSGNVYTTGSFEGTVDFDPDSLGIDTITSNGDKDIFIQKLSSAGNKVWTKTIGGSGEDKAHSIAIDRSGYIYATGSFEGSVNFDPGVGANDLGAAGLSDAFILKMNDNGELIWAKQLGGTNEDYGLAITTDSSANIYTTGHYSGTVDFDPGTGTKNLNATSTNNFIQKMSSCQYTYGTDTIVACVFYTWIDSITYLASNDSAIFTLTNVDGCDSIVTLNLTIDSLPNTSTTVNGFTITADSSNGSYQWLDCNNNYSILVNDTNQTYFASSNGSYAVEITKNGCMDTSACVVIRTVGIAKDKPLDSFEIYPNPTNGKFTITVETTVNKATISIYNLHGKLIKESNNLNAKTIDLNIVDQAAGIYFVVIETTNGNQTIQLIKK